MVTELPTTYRRTANPAARRGPNSSGFANESHKLPALHLEVGGPMGDALDHDVQALKEWLRSAWRQLAQSSMTRFDRQELRNYMRQAEAALQVASERVTTRDIRRRELFNASKGSRPPPDLRLLRALADSSGTQN